MLPILHSLVTYHPRCSSGQRKLTHSLHREHIVPFGLRNRQPWQPYFGWRPLIAFL